MTHSATAAILTAICVAATAPAVEPGPEAGSFDKLLQPVFRANCVDCHGAGGEVNGDVNLLKLTTADDLLKQPHLVVKLIDAVESGAMPPDDDSSLAPERRDAMVGELRRMLRIAAQRLPVPRTPIRRMTRLQYSNAVQDLFQLNVLVFTLPERMMREHGNYFQPGSGKMPPQLAVGSRPLGKSQLIERRLSGVAAFPQDLRAEHGFDNRGDHLSLSPLLLETFLRLGRSIVDSREFNAKTCGIWGSFFAPPPPDEPVEDAVRSRLRPFLTRAFRRPVEDELVERYAARVLAEIEGGATFTEGMKVAAAAALASPRFFYLYDRDAGNEDESDYNLASRLSFFLWGSLPDQTLLDLAAAGKLHEKPVLTAQVERMLRDRKLKRFCDSFPAQWLQLERIVSSAPDRERYRHFYITNDKYLASMHMMLEPLLLFETVLIENRPILEFIHSDYSYRSSFLDAWYKNQKRANPGSPVVVQFKRVPVTDRRQGGMITTAAVMTMTSGPRHTKPITRGAWVASVILNSPPEPPPANVPPLAEKPTAQEENLTLRERFALHRDNATCAGCHRRIDPFGFALENYDAVGMWRDAYENGRPVDASGVLFGRRPFADVVDFKAALLAEKDRFARGFASHLLSYALGREVGIADTLVLDDIVRQAAADDYRFQSLIHQVVLSDAFRQPPTSNE